MAFYPVMELNVFQTLLIVVQDSSVMGCHLEMAPYVFLQQTIVLPVILMMDQE